MVDFKDENIRKGMVEDGFSEDISPGIMTMCSLNNILGHRENNL